MGKAKGLFIVFEGIDGSGKTSCMEAVAKEIGKKRDVIVTAEPTKGPIGMLIRSSRDILPATEALLFTADRAEHTRRIKEWTEDGKTVLCDRYFASTLAYQSAELNGPSVPREWLAAVNSGVILKADMTFLFDIDPELGLERVEARGAKSKFESLGYLREVRKNYLGLAEEHGFTVIDASGSRDAVTAEVMRHMAHLLR